MLLAKRQGGTTVAGHHWKHDGAAVDVPYDLAMELLAIKGGGFYVPGPESPDPPKKAAPKPQAPPPSARA